MRKAKADWVVVTGANGEAAHCKRCGVGLELPMPMSLNVLMGAMEGFVKDHQRCKDTGRTEPEPANLDEWLRSRDTGISSRTICAVLSGRPVIENRPGYPMDPSDFGRCYRLLKLFPQWLPRLGEVADRYPEWRPLVEAWDELTALYEKEMHKDRSPMLYARMQELLAPVRRGFKIGPGVWLE